MSISHQIFFLYPQVLLADKLRIHILTRQYFPQPLRPSEHCSINCDIIIGIYKQGEITKRQLLAFLTDSVLYIEKTTRRMATVYYSSSSV